MPLWLRPKSSELCSKYVNNNDDDNIIYYVCVCDCFVYDCAHTTCAGTFKIYFDVPSHIIRVYWFIAIPYDVILSNSFSCRRGVRRMLCDCFFFFNFQINQSIVRRRNTDGTKLSPPRAELFKLLTVGSRAIFFFFLRPWNICTQRYYNRIHFVRFFFFLIIILFYFSFMQT